MADRWVNAVITCTKALDVPLDASKEEKLDAATKVWEDLNTDQDTVCTVTFENVEDGEPIIRAEPIDDKVEAFRKRFFEITVATPAFQRQDLLRQVRDELELRADRHAAILGMASAESEQRARSEEQALRAAISFVDSLALDAQEVPPQPLEPIDDKVEAFRKRFFERTGERLQRTAVVEGLRAALGGEAAQPVGEEPGRLARQVENASARVRSHPAYLQPKDERESTEEAPEQDKFVPVMWFLRLEVLAKEKRRDEATEARARDWYEVERRGLQATIDLIMDMRGELATQSEQSHTEEGKP